MNLNGRITRKGRHTYVMRDVRVEDGEAGESCGARLAVPVRDAEPLEPRVRDGRRRNVQVAQIGARHAHLA